MSKYDNCWQIVEVKVEVGIVWVMLNCFEKCNVMSFMLNQEMFQVFDVVEFDDEVKVFVLIGVGVVWMVGMDLKEYFCEIDGGLDVLQEKVCCDVLEWQWCCLWMYGKLIIVMVNGWCFGGGFLLFVVCDFVIVVDEVVFGLLEINWGILFGNFVSKVMVDMVGYCCVLYYIMIGDMFIGVEVVEMGFVNSSVLFVGLCDVMIVFVVWLMDKNLVVLCVVKYGFKCLCEFMWEQCEDYLYVKFDQV